MIKVLARSEKDMSVETCRSNTVGRGLYKLII